MAQTNFIGTYPMITMSMVPIGQKQTTDLEIRPGVDGVYVWLTGTRGEPFEVQTVTDVNSAQDAVVLMQFYEALVGTVVPVMFANWIMPKQYVVLNVRPIPDQCRQVLVGIGGTGGGPSYGILAASWTLVATEEDA